MEDHHPRMFERTFLDEELHYCNYLYYMLPPDELRTTYRREVRSVESLGALSRFDHS